MTAVSVTGVVVAVAAALPLGVSPVDVRPGGPSCQPAGSMTLCLWPEHSAARAKAEKALLRVDSVAAGSGIILPKTLTELDPQRVRWPVSSIEVSPRATDLRSSVANSLFPNPQCLRTGPLPSGVSVVTPYAVVALWWAHRLGVESSAVETNDEAQAKFTQLMRLSPAKQIKEVNAMITAGEAVCAVANKP